MTGLISHFIIFILFICVCFSSTSVNRMFSDFKRCADDECSMLLCRGKASKDFVGPDCRFLSFKKGETIFVYYKLSGQRSDVWAGSIGSTFGYFPKELLNINHVYTEKEVEVRAEVTDFVCFDTGQDQFKSYDLDVLLSNSLLNELNDKREETVLGSEDSEMDDTIGDTGNSVSSHTESEAKDAAVDTKESSQAPLETFASHEHNKGSSVISEGITQSPDDHTTQVEAFPELNTTLGTTFDAVTSDDEITQKVTPYDDGDQSNDDMVQQPGEEESLKKPSLITFEDKSHYSEDSVHGANKSEDEHVPVQKEERTLGEKATKVGGKKEARRDIEDSDRLHTESAAKHTAVERKRSQRDSEDTQMPLEASYEQDKDKHVIKQSPDRDSDPQQPINKDKPSSKDAGVLEKSDHTTQTEAFPKLQTTLGTTFDAVTSDDEITQKVTPYDEGDQSNDDVVQQPSEEKSVKKPSLITFEEKPRYSNDSVPSAPRSEDKQVPVQKEEMVLSENTAKGGETEDKRTNHKDVVNSSSVHTESGAGLRVNTDDLRDSEAAQAPLETIASYERDKDRYAGKQRPDGDTDPQRSFANGIPDEPTSKNTGPLEKSDHTTQVPTFSKLETTLGTTFDAVISDDEITQKVTPYDEGDQINDVDQQPDEEESVKKPSLITFDEKPRNSWDIVNHSVPGAHKSEDKHVPLHPPAPVKATNNDSTLSNIENTGFKPVSEGKRTDLPEDDDGDDAHMETMQKDSDQLQTNLVPVSETREGADAIKPSINDPVKMSSNDNKRDEVQEQNTNVFEYDNELEEIKNKPLGPDEHLIDDVESEYNPKTSASEDVKPVLDKPIDEKEILMPIPSETESEAVFKQGARSESELSKQPDELMDKVKHETVELHTDPLESEKREAYFNEEEENDEELLEDENAVLSATAELPDEEKELDESSESTKLESQLGKNELATPKQPYNSSGQQSNEKTSGQVNHEGETSVETLLDDPVSPPANENNGTSVKNGADEEYLKDSSRQDPEEPEYSDSVLRLTLLRDRFDDDEIKRILRHFNVTDLYKIEAMFTELDRQLKSATQTYSQNNKVLEHTLANILEVSESDILEEIDKMLDAREQRALALGQQIDHHLLDEEAAVLDDFQEFVYDLHQKYLPNEMPLMKESQSHFEMENVSEVVEDPVETMPVTEAPETPEVHQDTNELFNANDQEEESHSQDVGPGDDGGHFNKNEDIPAAFQDTAEIQRGPQAILENPLDIVGFEIEPSSDSLDSSRASDSNPNYDQASTSSMDHTWDFFLLASEFLVAYAEKLMSALPEEWQPGPTFHGLPWKPVVATAAVGILTVLMFTWRTILAVKSRTYLLTEKQLNAKIEQLVSEKSDVLQKVTELNKSIKNYEEKLNNSKESRCSLEKQFNELKTHYHHLNTQKEKLCVNFNHLCEKIANTQEENKTLNEKITTMHQGIKIYQKTINEYDDERSKVQVLMDEAKLREDALKAQVLSFEKDNCALKEQKKSLLRDAKDWQEKHEKLSEEIKVYHKTQTELENSLVHKENEIDVLSGFIADLKNLEPCNDTEVANDKNGDPLKLHLKQMMDVSRIKATLSVIEEERNRWFENFMAEQKARQELEEKFQKVTHDQTNLKNEKAHLENQYKNLQQRLEITTELYHQKENILHQKLTQEELERHDKETKLSEVDGRALQAEEELSRLRQKVKDMQEEMQENERSLKAEIAVQEKKAHENWLKARASERALIEERRECANLRQKIVECSDKMSDLEHAMYKSGPSERHMPPVQRAGDSYGPSPVSGGAPSPPLMIEGPGRPPSGPVGRRSEPFGPRQLMDRSTDLGHPLPFRPELPGPRTSSPCTQDGSISKSQRQGPFLPSPVRESPVPTSNAVPKVYGPQPMGPFPPLNGPLPPAMRPPNGQSPMIPPGAPFGPEACFRPPHMDPYRPPFPLRPFGPLPPPFVHGPPLRDFPSLGPHPPQPGRHDFPPNFAGPQDFPFPPRPFPSGPLPPPGIMVPPTVGIHGPAPPLQPRDSQELPHAADVPPKQRDAQDAPTPSVTQS